MTGAICNLFSAIEADISALDISCIVNAANESLIMGGGVDGAIRRKASPEMEKELRRIRRCPTGGAVLTDGHRLPAKYVIHTVAPVWETRAGSREENLRLLAGCYANSLALARGNGIAEIAFPCMGTGIYGWPADLAAGIAFETVTNFLDEQNGFSRIVFCCFCAAHKDRYAELIAAVR
ncbi:MAG TPA: macro domain-containing protein [Rhizomicrobium sp.]|jgi:O-acetyl-ADP-ribose deacetylase (regulator of RNase III)|nr:macro domain-containing protein [Rhizomicrobium sp.]